MFGSTEHMGSNWCFSSDNSKCGKYDVSGPWCINSMRMMMSSRQRSLLLLRQLNSNRHMSFYFYINVKHLPFFFLNKLDEL